MKYVLGLLLSLCCLSSFAEQKWNQIAVGPTMSAFFATENVQVLSKTKLSTQLMFVFADPTVIAGTNTPIVKMIYDVEADCADKYFDVKTFAVFEKLHDTKPLGTGKLPTSRFHSADSTSSELIIRRICLQLNANP